MTSEADTDAPATTTPPVDELPMPPMYSITDLNYTLLKDNVWLVVTHSDASCKYSSKFMESAWLNALRRLASNSSLKFYYPPPKSAARLEDDSSINVQSSSHSQQAASSSSSPEIRSESTTTNIVNDDDPSGTQKEEIQYRFAHVNAAVDSRTAAFLEVQAFPTVKLIQMGNVWTMRDNLTEDEVVRFVTDGWRKQSWYNRLPHSWSIWFKIQLDAYHFLANGKIQAEDFLGVKGTPLSSAVLYSAAIIAVLILILGPFALVWVIEKATGYKFREFGPARGAPAAARGGEADAAVPAQQRPVAPALPQAPNADPEPEPERGNLEE